MDKVKVTKDLENKTLVVERTFDAPKENVWRAYSEKDMFEGWWGPEGWVTTTKEFDFRQGGKIHYCMKCVDEKQGEFFGQESWGLMVIETIDAPNSFSAMDYFSDASGAPNANMPAQRFVVEFVDEGGRTRLVNRSVSESAEQLEQLVQMGMIEGFASQLNRLEALLKA